MHRHLGLKPAPSVVSVWYLEKGIMGGDREEEGSGDLPLVRGRRYHLN